MAWPSRSPDLTPMDYFLWAHIKALIYLSPVDSADDLIARIVEATATITQQPGILSAHVSLCCFVVGCVSRSVAAHLNIRSKLLRNTNFFFFRILQWFCLISKLCPNLMVRKRCKVASPTYSSLTINLCFGPCYHLAKFGNGFFFPALFVVPQTIIYNYQLRQQTFYFVKSYLII